MSITAARPVQRPDVIGATAQALAELLILSGRDDSIAVHASLTRSAPPAPARSGPARAPVPPAPSADTWLWIHRDFRTVHSHDGEIELSRREFDLLLFLAEQPRRVFTRTRLITAVWADTYAGERTVDVHMRRLRVKIGPVAGLIATVRGVGYRFDGHHRVAVLREPARIAR